MCALGNLPPSLEQAHPDAPRCQRWSPEPSRTTPCVEKKRALQTVWLEQVGSVWEVRLLHDNPVIINITIYK